MLCSLRLAGAAPFLASLDQGCARRGPRARAQKRRAGKNKQKIRKSVRGSRMKIVRLSHPCPPASKRGAPSFAMGWGVLTDPERVAPVDEGRPPARTGLNAGGRNEAVCSVSRPGWRSTSLSAPRAPDTDRARLLAGGTSQVAPRGREQGEQQAEGSAQAESGRSLSVGGAVVRPKRVRAEQDTLQLRQRDVVSFRSRIATDPIERLRLYRPSDLLSLLEH